MSGNNYTEEFTEVYKIVADQQTPLEDRIKSVIDAASETDVSAKEVLLSYGASLRKNDPLDNNTRRVSTLITAAERYGVELDLEEIIDASLHGNTGPNLSTPSTESQTEETVNIINKKSSELSINDSSDIGFDINFEDPEAVMNSAVSISNNDEFTLQQKRSALKELLNTAQEKGVDVSPSEVREAINSSKGGLSDTPSGKRELEPSTVSKSDDISDKQPQSPEIEVTDVSVSSTGVKAGESITIFVQLENVSDVTGIKEVRILQNHEVIQTSSVTVESGETVTEQLEVTFDTGGSHLLQIENEPPVEITVLSPTNISVTDLSATPTETPPNETTTVIATIENTGDFEGTANLQLVTDAFALEERDVTVESNTTITESFDVTFDKPGEYTISLGEESTTVTALEPASVNVVEYRLSSTGVATNETLTVTTDIKNTGDIEGTIAVALYSNGDAIETKSVDVAGKDTETVSFDTSFDRTGSHSLTINNLDPTDVTVLKPASAAVKSFTLSTHDVSPDEPLSAFVTVTNNGDLSDSLTLSVSISGEIVFTDSIEIQGNTTKEIEIGPSGDIQFEFKEHFENSGVYPISINGEPSQEIRLLDPADVNVRYYSLSENEIDPGDNVAIDVEVENTGDVTGETDVNISVDGDVVITEPVTVDGNSDKRGTFEYSLDKPGEYTFSVNGLDSTRLTVRKEGNVMVHDSHIDADLDSPFYVGDPISVDFTAKNHSSIAAEKTFSLYLDEVELTSETHYFDSQEEQSFSISGEPTTNGTFNLKLNDYVIGEVVIEYYVPTVDLENIDYISTITQCIGHTSSGSRCNREIEANELACWQHNDVVDNLSVKEIDQCMYVNDDGTQCTATSELGGLLCSEHNPLDETFEPDILEEPSDEPVEHDSEETTEESSVEESGSEGERKQTESTADSGSSTNELGEGLKEMMDEEDIEGDPDHTRSPNSLSEKLSFNSNTRTLVGFDFVLDDDEDFLPNDVNANGMISDGEDYFAIAEVQPRSWSIHTPSEKQDIINQYRSLFLGSIDFPVQIVCYPTEFDISEHVETLEELTTTRNTRNDESELLNIGRNIYPTWFREYIARSNMKQRNFYIIVRVKPSQLNRFRQDNDGVLDTIEERAPAIAHALEKIIPGVTSETDVSDISEKDCLVELHDRIQRIESSLNPMGVKVDPIHSRDKAMSVLYQYYNNERPDVDNFDVETRSEYAPTMRIDEGDWPTDALTDIHYEDYTNNTGDTQ